MAIIREFRDVDQLSPGDFELFVRDLFEAAGWSDLHVTKVGQEFRHGDGGVDIFARREGRRFAIEVKHRTGDNTVGVDALNQLVTGARLASVKQMILVTNSYFTSEVRVRALQLGVELIDRGSLQDMWVQKDSEIGRRIKPRVYQKAVIDDILDKYQSGKTKFLIEMATGLGKTYTAAELTRHFLSLWSSGRPRVLFLAHQVELLHQAITSFKNVLGIGKYTFSTCFNGAEPEKTDFVFASFDTFFGKLEHLRKDDYDLVIVDEAHHTPANTFSQVVESLHPRVLVGLTATPYRSDGRDVHTFFGGEEGHVGRYDLVWGLANNKLAHPKYTVLMHDLSPEDVAHFESGLTLSELDHRLFLHRKDEEVIRIIKDTIKEKAIDSPKAIVFCRNIAHMRHLLPFFPAGKATLVHSARDMSAAQRRSNISDFREGDYTYILVCDLFNEGVDIPETNLLIFLRRTASRVIWLQQLGRGLRKTKNKDYVHVLDFVGSLEKLREVQQLEREITQAESDPAEVDDRETHHDHRIEVNYNRAAAQIIPLIETMQLRLKSRQAAIEAMRRYVEKHGREPSVQDVERELDDITYDQIATHFDSYSGFLDAALGTNYNREALQDDCIAKAREFRSIHEIWPTPRALSDMLKYKCLPLFTSREVRGLPGVSELLDTSEPTSSTPSQSPDPEHASNLPVTPTTEISPGSDPIRTELIQEYVSTITSIEELRELPEHVLNQIQQIFRSDFAFLKELRLEREREATEQPSMT